MYHCKVLSRNALQFTISKSVVRRSSMSSLAPQGQFIQSYLPPMVVSAAPSISSNDLRTALILSLNTQPQRTSLLVDVPPYPLRTPVWHVTPLEIQMSPHPLAIRHLENATPEPKPEEREAEKPKWEEEQFPDIGKTIDTVRNHLPFLLIQPLPPSILAPTVEVRLFPSTHPNFPRLRLPKFAYRTFARAIRWFAPVFLHRSLSAFGSPSGVKGIGLEITCLRVIQIENGRRIEARWRTSASPWQPTSPPTSHGNGTSVEAMPRTWSGWFYFDINPKGLITRHIVENVDKSRNGEKLNGGEKLKEILVRTVNGRRSLGEGFGNVEVEREEVAVRRRMLKMKKGVRRIWPRIFPEESPSTIFITVRNYC